MKSVLVLFAKFISSLYASRQKSKKKGDEAMSYIYKILMNALYGRLGINPESRVTEIYALERDMKN